MRVVFFGTPEYAAVTLTKLLDAGYSVVMAVTQPDKPRDRGKKLHSPPVKELAARNGIPVLQPECLKHNGAFVDQLRAASADIFIVVAYGKILPSDILELPELGCINIHASLLPRFRGAAPIQRAVIEGAEETGVTLMYMNTEMDAGDIIAVRRTAVGHKSAADLFDELSVLGAELLLEELPGIASGQVKKRPQDHSHATYAPVIRKEEGHLDFKKTSDELDRIVRGMNAQSGAYAFYQDTVLKIWEAVSIADYSRSSDSDAIPVNDGVAVPGTILETSNEGIIIASGNGVLKVNMLQAPGKRVMAVGEYLRGNKISAGDIFY